MSGVKVGDAVFVKSCEETGNSTEMFWRLNPNFTQGTVLEIRDGFTYRHVTVSIPGRGQYTFVEDEVVVVGSSIRKIEFKDVQVGDLIKVTERVQNQEESTIKTIRVSSIWQSDRGMWVLESSQTYPHLPIRIYISRSGRLYNQTIELLDRPTATPKRKYAVGDVVSADDLFEVDVEVVVRYADVTGAVSLGVVIPGSDEIVFPDARMSLGGITRQTRYEIVYVEKEGSK